MSKIKNTLRRCWCRIRATVYSTVWGERSWYDYPPERWWYLHKYTIKRWLEQLRHFACYLLLAAELSVVLTVILAGIYLATTPATAWVNFEKGDAELTLNVLYKNGPLLGDPTHTPAAICCTVRSEGGGIPLEVFTCKDVRGYPFPLGYFRIPIETRERIISVSVELVYDVYAGGRVIEIVPSPRIMSVSPEGWEILH